MTSLALLTAPLLGYLGPQGVFGSIWALLGLIGVVLLAVVGFFWYPIKRLLGLGKDSEDELENDT